MKFLTKRLMADIKEGGIILCPRRSGKTTAALSYLKQDADSILSCHKERIAHTLRQENRDLEKRIFGPQIQSIVGRPEKLIIDEYLLHGLTPLGYPFHAALATSPRRVVAYDKRGKRVVIKSDVDNYRPTAPQKRSRIRKK